MNPLRQLRNRSVSRNLNQLHDEQATLGERLADGLARFGGSWTFLIGFAGALVLWIGLNSLQLLMAPFDPYPFIFLNLVLSCLAAIQAPIIMMSQNRQAARDRLAAELDFACNTKAERVVEQLHEKLDLLREKQWMDLVELQQHQITLLNQLLDQRTVPPSPAPSEESPEAGCASGPDGNGGGRRHDAPPDHAVHPPNGPSRRRARVVDGQTHLRWRRGPGEAGQINL